MIRLNRRAFLLLAFLTLSEVILFSPSFGHYFQGDSLYWLAQRYTRLSQVAAAFGGVDSYGYFRPLSHRLIPSLFFPVFGLDPLGYHWVVAFIFAVTVGVAFLFFRDVTGDDWEAAFATFFFSVHSVNAFVTFDFAFAPELFYGLFYLLAAFCFRRWLTTGASRWNWFSLAFFGLGLLSKEAAATLPANLFWLALLIVTTDPTRRPSIVKRLVAAGKATTPHWLLLAGYLSYLAFGLRGGRLLLGAASTGNGLIGAVSIAWSNLALAIPWSMNLAAGDRAAWRHLPVGLEWFLALLAALLAAGALDAALRPRPRKRLILVGLLWFLTALTPMLTLTDFKSYYLYTPLIGLSLAVGRILASAWRVAAARRVWAGNLVMGVVVVLLWASCRLIVAGDLARHPLLGGGAEVSQSMARDIQRIRPSLPVGATLFVLDQPDHPLYWHTAGGRLFRLVYGDPSLKVLYASLGDRPTPEEMGGESFVAVAFQKGGLEDVTGQSRGNPDSLFDPQVSYSEEVPGLIQIEPAEVHRGEGRYTLRIVGKPNQQVEVQFRVDGGPAGFFKARLNSLGEVSFYVSSDNRKGIYEFLAVRRDGNSWSRSDPPARLTVR